jgi:tripartite-type tricarboxylate transporter receptor subunit TctC
VNSKTIIFCSAALFAAPAMAQDWPASRPVKVISSFTAGSPADALIRMMAAKVTESIGQPMVVEVQAGAGGQLAAQSVARAAPDGHTMMYTVSTTVLVTPQIVKGSTLSIKDFTPILVVSKAVTSMFVAPDFPANNLKEFVAYVKANPGKVAYGTNGIGGLYHLEMSLLSAKLGLDMVHVPYKGGTDALQAVASGTLPVGFVPIASALAQARAGKVKVIGVLEYKRVPSLPDVPALGEQLPEYEKLGSGVDIWGPAKMPASIAKRIFTEIDKAAALPDVHQKMTDIAFPYDGLALDQMAATRLKDVDVATRAIKAAGLKPE